MGADLTSRPTERWHRLGSALLAATGAACGAVLRQVVHSPGSIEWSWRPLFISIPAGLLLSFVLERAYERRRGGAEGSPAPHLGRWQVAATVIAIVIVGLEQVTEEIFAIVVRNRLALVNWLILFVQAGLLTYAWLDAAQTRPAAGARRGARVGDPARRRRRWWALRGFGARGCPAGCRAYGRIAIGGRLVAAGSCGLGLGLIVYPPTQPARIKSW